MKIVETTYTINKGGGLKIPSTDLKAMGLNAGEHIRVAYLSRDGIHNDDREFLLSGESIAEDSGEEAQISIPAALMEQANIPQDADLQIVCCDGCIVIMRDSALSIDELTAVLSALETAEELATQMPAGAELWEIKDALKSALEKREEVRVDE